ncbi:MAG: RNA polymerase sigma factor [Planctomycetes bacterium]|nr:RNA polymerase sigma factor [Planctomycetota bacterium]
MAAQDRTEDLVRRAQRGDRAAFGELFESHRRRLLARIAARCGRKLQGALDPEDVLQETFLRAFETVHLFVPRGEDSFFRWLAAIAEHLLLNASRKRRPDPLEVTPEPVASGASPSKALRREERFDRLEEALRGLPEDRRRAVLMARIDGLSAREIARRMGRSEEAVRQLLARALKQLKRTLGGTESFGLPDRPLGEKGISDA